MTRETGYNSNVLLTSLRYNFQLLFCTFLAISLQSTYEFLLRLVQSWRIVRVNMIFPSINMIEFRNLFFHFYTLLIEGILVLSVRVGRIEILIWDPMFLGDIWSAQTFELCLSIRPFVVITIASERKKLRTSNFAHKLLLPIRWLLLKMGYIGLQDLVPPI